MKLFDDGIYVKNFFDETMVSTSFVEVKLRKVLANVVMTTEV